MDNLTHTLFALTLRHAGLGRNVPGATAVLVVSSNAPDVDIVTALTGGALKYLEEHRGPTHGPIGVVTLATLTAAIVKLAWRGDRTDLPFSRLWALAFAGVAFHVLMDYPTAYRTRIWDPFDTAWYGFDWLPIIDVSLWAVLVVGLIVGSVRFRHRTAIAALALALTVGNYALRGTLHSFAIADARNPAAIEAAAIPTFSSPFRWRLIRRQADGYQLREIDLLRRARGRPSPSTWIPHEENEWTSRASRSATARIFLDFSRFPAVRTNYRPDGTIVVRWNDLRFLNVRLFTASVRMDRSGRVLEERIGEIPD